MKDHIILHFYEKKTTKEMFDALIGLFQSTNMNMKMVLRSKFIWVQMSIYNNVTNYLMRIIHVCDQITSIREKTKDIELVNVTLNGLPKTWEPFSKGFFA
jgi:hypothetical protein